MEKILKEKFVETLSLYDLDGKTLGEIIDYFQYIIDTSPSCVVENIIRINTDDGYSCFDLYAKIWETNKEFERRKKKLEAKRIADAKRRKENKLKQDEIDSIEYERLKKKFGKSND